MNIKEWKQFSDLVDKHNNKRSKSFTKLSKFIEKTQENFWEWKAGKLKL